jgi:RNA polymerase sigma-70 factor (ECF subfamily)
VEPTAHGGEDAALVRDVVAGSHDALAELYDRHASLVFSIARRVTGDRAIAEEVVQETFLALWNRAELFDPATGSLTTWLVAIARNRSLDRVRAARRRPQAVPIGEPGAGAPGEDELERAFAMAPGDRGGPDPAAVLVREEDREAVRRALTSLDDAERAVIVLAYQDGLTQAEIAERLGWPLGTVKTRTRRALRSLRAVLAPSGRQADDATTGSRPAVDAGGPDRPGGSIPTARTYTGSDEPR